MSQENVEVCKRGNALFNTGDRDGALSDFHPDVEWRDLDHAPDALESVRGVAAVRAIWDQWNEAFDEFTAETAEYIDVGDCVVCVTHWRATGKASAVAVDLHRAEVYEFENGRIVRASARARST
jgi:ketosteroid isomerase-like protein